MRSLTGPPLQTTGPWKRIEVLTAHVGKDSYLACRDWLGAGFSLFKMLGGLPRDYLLESLGCSARGPFFDYIVSITGRSRSRCLHMADGCYRARDFKFVQYEVYPGIVDAQLYDNVCMACWKGSSLHRAATAHTASPVSDCEDSSSSSTSSL